MKIVFELHCMEILSSVIRQLISLMQMYIRDGKNKLLWVSKAYSLFWRTIKSRTRSAEANKTQHIKEREYYVYE